MTEPSRRIHIVSDGGSDVSRDAADRLREQQVIPTRNLGLERAGAEPADQVGFLGPKRSKELAAHERRMRGIYWAGRESAYAFTVGTAIEYTAFSTGKKFARAVQQELDAERPDSLAGAYAEMLALDALSRVRGLAGDAMREYKSRTLGG